MLRTFALFAVIGAMLFVSRAAADDDEKEKGKPKRHPELIFKKLDTNNDGKLTLDEFKKLADLRKGNGKGDGDGKGKMLEKLFQRLDTDKDGTLSLDEFKKLGDAKGKKGGKKAEEENL